MSSGHVTLRGLRCSCEPSDGHACHRYAARKVGPTDCNRQARLLGGRHRYTLVHQASTYVRPVVRGKVPWQSWSVGDGLRPPCQ